MVDLAFLLIGRMFDNHLLACLLVLRLQLLPDQLILLAFTFLLRSCHARPGTLSECRLLGLTMA